MTVGNRSSHRNRGNAAIATIPAHGPQARNDGRRSARWRPPRVARDHSPNVDHQAAKANSPKPTSHGMPTFQPTGPLAAFKVLSAANVVARKAGAISQSGAGRSTVTVRESRDSGR